ncbi:hypothetical protein Tco_1343161 [Tanacetum coccineum]
MAVGDDINKSGDDSNKKHDDIGSSFELNLSIIDTLYLHPNDTGGSPIQFDAIINLPPGTCDAAKDFEKHNQLIKLMQFLMGLDESYLAIKSNILTREPLPLVKAAFAVVSDEESHRNATSVGATKPTASAFTTKTFDYKRSLLDILLVMLKGTLMPIPDMFSNNASADVNSNNTNTDTRNRNSPVSLSNEQISRLMSLLNDSGVFSANANMADYYSRAVWVYMLKGKDDVYDSIVSFVQMIPSSMLRVVSYKGCYHKNFFDNENPKRPNDDGKVSYYDDCTELSSDSQNDNDSRLTFIDESTHLEGNLSDETYLVGNFYENIKFNSESVDLPVNAIRMSSRQTKLSTGLNDFIVEGKVKYGVERVVNSNLSFDKFSFASSLNKSIEPTCYKDAILDDN